jgi:ABC-type multidrug transport system fused ATPase/permease subunit
MSAAVKDQSEEQAGSERRRGIIADITRLRMLWPYLRADKRLILFAGALIPMISGVETALPLVLKQTIDHGIVGKDMPALLRYAAWYLLLILLAYAARSAQSVATALAVLRMIKTMREKLFWHVMSLKAAFHDRSMSGALVTRATSDFDNLSETLNMGVLTSVVDVAVLIGCIGGMFTLNWRLALCALVILPVVGAVVQWFSKGLKAAMLQARVKIAALNAFTQECLFGHTTIKLLSAEARAESEYHLLNIEYRDAQMGSVILDATMFAVLDGIASITLGLVLWVVVAGVTKTSLAQPSWGDALSAGVIVAFVAYIQQLFEPLKQLGNKMAMLQGAFTSIDRIFGVLGRGEQVHGTVVLDTLRGDVTFEHVSFGYGDVQVLKDVSFTLKAGQSLALVGATGSGKSTIVKLLAKLYDGYTGRILVDGYDLTELEPQALRQLLAIVPQDIVLFDGSIAFNIGLGLPGATPERIARAAKQASAEAFIARLPKGLNEDIKEQGSNLSHGQRQLLAFARALVKAPNLVILDEATSSIDRESERTIQEATQSLLKDRSVIVIAHRLSTIRQCDHILVVDKGRIVEAGNHVELLAKRGAYFDLYKGFVAAESSELQGDSSDLIQKQGAPEALRPPGLS